MEPTAGQHGSNVSLPIAPREAMSAWEAVQGVRPEIRGLYVHVPFCFHKCHYCDFYSFVDRPLPSGEDRQEAYVRRVGEEFAAARALFRRPVETIFVGGGTPTFLRPPLLRALLACLRDGVQSAAGFAADVEWTVEANPETVTKEVAEILVEAGVGRVSLGAQSFDPRHLKTLERWHDPQSVGRAVDRLRRAGIRRINVDLIFGIPGSSLHDWASDLEQALTLGPQHLSCYGLTYEPNTALSKRLELGQVTPCDEGLEAAMYEHTLDRLAGAGFEAYEISNFARAGEECRHNLLYWTNADWWALGPSGSAHVQGVRFKNLPRITDWLATPGTSPVVDVEQLGPDVQAGELLLVGLRLMRGLERAVVDRCCDVDRTPTRGAERAMAIVRHVEGGLLEWRDDRLRLTRRGMLLADEVLADLV